MAREKDTTFLAGLILSVGIPVATMAAELLIKALLKKGTQDDAAEVPVVEAGLLFVGQTKEGKIVAVNKTDRDVVLTFQKSHCEFIDGGPRYSNESVAAVIDTLSGPRDISLEVEAFTKGGEMTTNFLSAGGNSEVGGLAKFITRVPVWAATIWNLASSNLTLTRGIDEKSGKAWIKVETTRSLSNIILSLTDAAGKRFSKSKSIDEKSSAGAGPNVHEIEIPSYIDISGIMTDLEVTIVAAEADVRSFMTKELPLVPGVKLVA